jgi:hypothetical protein
MKLPHVKFYVVMETFPDNHLISLRQECCVFDNQKKVLCKHPENIDVAEIWSALKNQSYIGGLILGQYQKEAKQHREKRKKASSERR